MSDLIERQAAIDALADYIHNVDKVMGTGKLSAHDCKDAARSVLDDLPAAQPEPKRGRWVDFSMSVKGVPTEACSECGTWSLDMGKRFCPNCGADMRGEQDE